jgi:hypothetical protein
MPGTRRPVIVRLPLFVLLHRLDASIPVSKDNDIRNRREADKLYVNAEHIPEGVWQQGSHPTDVQTTDSTSESSVLKGRNQDDGDKTQQVTDTLDEDSVEANRWAM